MNLGNNLFQARKKAGLSQETVAEKLGVSRQTISKWESDETLPDIYQSKKLSRLYNCSLDELIEFDVELNEIEKEIENSNEERKCHFYNKKIGIIFLIASSAILALKQLTESSDNKQRYIILRKIGCDEKMINQALFRQIFIFFMMPLLLAIIHSIFGIKFMLSLFSVLVSSNKLLPSIITTAVIIGVIYVLYFLATYFESKNIIKGEE